MPRSRSLLLASAAGLALCAATFAPAHAEGGTTIAGAPTVTIGTPEFGNTANGTEDDENYRREFFLLPAKAGDAFTVDWEEGQDANVEMFVCPPGTNDYNLADADCDGWDVNPNGKAETTWTAQRTGTEILDFLSYESGAGPFDFTVHVKHKAVLSLGRLKAARKGKVTVAAYTPDGRPVASGLMVQLQIRSGGKWAAIAKAPVSAGVARISYRLSKAYSKHRVGFRALGSGGSYARATSSTQTVRIR